ncbi:hypothetical protein B0H19DRAFT_1268000 [Mycena capillaripes]|nr:hypothetical protein B0H19DRAFT_1268000 [Mycena capillaripes]
MAFPPRFATAVLAQELWDCIIDDVEMPTHSYPSDLYRYLHLRSCSLVCRAFTHRSQMHLFRKVDFARPWAADNASDMFADAWASGDSSEVRNMPYVPYDRAAACHRLCTVLKSAPHLIPLIREIHLPFVLEALAQISRIGLSMVNTIYASVPGYYKGPRNIEDVSAIALLHWQGLFAMPSVCEVRINGGSFVSVIQLSRLFKSPSPALLSLHIKFLDFSQNNHNTVDFNSGRQRIWLRELHLQSKAAGVWFARPDCPFDLSRLVVANIVTSLSTDLGTALRDAHTLKRLRLDIDPGIENLDFSRFPALTHLEIVCSCPENLLHIVPILSVIAANNRIEKLGLEMGIFPKGSEELLRGFDDIMACPHMPALRIVTLTIEEYHSTPVHIHNPKPPTDAVVREDVLRSFPKLQEKGCFILDIFSVY